MKHVICFLPGNAEAQDRFKIKANLD